MKYQGYLNSTKKKINGFEKIYLDKNSNQIKLSLFKTSEIDTNKNTEKKQNIFNLVESLDIFALIQDKKIRVNKFKLNLDGGTINGEGTFESSNAKISGEIILKSKRLSILENLIFNLDLQNKKEANQTFLINKFAANNINSEISLNYFFTKGDIDYKIKKLSVFIEDLNAKNTDSKNVFYLKNGKVDYQLKKFQGFFNNLRINNEILASQLNIKYFEEYRYEVVAKTIETNSFSLKKFTQDFFPKSINVNVDFFENPKDKIVFNDFSLKIFKPRKIFLRQ